jgi:hypothetical protein
MGDGQKDPKEVWAKDAKKDNAPSNNQQKNQKGKTKRRINSAKKMVSQRAKN